MLSSRRGLLALRAATPLRAEGKGGAAGGAAGGGGGGESEATQRDSDAKYRLVLKMLNPPPGLKPIPTVTPELYEKRAVIAIAWSRFAMEKYKRNVRSDTELVAIQTAARARFKEAFPAASEWADKESINPNSPFPFGKPTSFETPPWDYSDEAPYK